MADAFIFRECKGKRVVRVASMRKKERKRKGREEKENTMEASNIVFAHKSIATRIISRRARAIDH